MVAWFCPEGLVLVWDAGGEEWVDREVAWLVAVWEQLELDRAGR